MALEKDCFIHKNALTGIEPVRAFFLNEARRFALERAVSIRVKVPWIGIKLERGGYK